MREDVSDRQITIERLVTAAREVVFKAFTDAEQIDKWWGPNGFTNTTEEIDVRTGGVWRFTMHGPDGTDYPNRIEYIEVVPPEKLEFLHAGEGDYEFISFHSTVTFTEQDSVTLVTLSNTYKTAEELEFVVKKHGAVEGGKQTLGRLAEFVERIAVGETL